jgi:hypothetical protein
MAIRKTITNRLKVTLRLTSPTLAPPCLRHPHNPQLPERMGTGGLSIHIHRVHPALGRHDGIVACL